MADKSPEQEPSIEEILASIRQIISDDDDKPDAPADPEPFVAAAPVAEPEQEPEEDVLELTEKFEEPSPIQVDLQEHVEPVLPEPEPEEVVMEPAIAPKAIESEILTEAARSATITSMAKLAGNMPLTRHREYGNITLEDLVREMLNPMLKDWLSDNLPPMVERMVQKELEKLARQAQDV